MRTPRTVTDTNGVVWEIFREDEDALGAVLEWGHQSTTGNPGLIFTSTAGMRRLSPAPDGWEGLSDEALQRLLALASELY